jgi:hypothetical protein
MGESSWNYNMYSNSRIFADDYRYVFLDDDGKVEDSEVVNSIRQIKQRGALQTLYKNLDIDEKRELMELILNDSSLL